MVAIELDPVREQKLRELARAQGQDGPTLARQVLTDYLDFQMLPRDSEEAWAEASTALAPEFMDQEDWGQGNHGS